jgi:hypothetical protein
MGTGAEDMSTTQQPEALRDARWYMIDKDGMATLCTDREDAEKEAKKANMAWPHTAPHRAVQLVEVASVAASAGSEPVAHLWQHSETGRTRVVMPDAVVDASASWLLVGPLYLHPSPPEGMVGGWRPMADAPRDGTSVIAVNAATNPGRQHIVRFEDRRPHQPWRTGAGPMDWVAGLTHWMPLPLPPTTSAGSGKGE